MRRVPEQLELDRRRWGGRRPGAGRRPGQRPRVRHLSRGSFAERFPCHLTLKLREGVPSLRTVRVVREIERSWAVARDRGQFRLVHYSLQGNHAHLIVEARDRFALARGMKSLAARLARAVNRISRRKGPVLADRYHLRVLRTPREVRNALAYVLLNARRHATRGGRRLARALRLDPASSGAWFDGWQQCLPAGAPGRAPPVARARTWLLREGWRRWGLLDPSEVPGG